MLFSSIVFSFIVCLVQKVYCAPSASPPISRRATAFTTFSGVTIFTPPSTYTSPDTLYARQVLLSDSSILATFENYSPNPPYFPIYRSTNGGLSWTLISKVVDTQNGWGMRYQPFLYQLPSAIGAFPAGTILCAGNSIPNDLSKTQIDLYASLDKGYTWKFVSHIASGGEALPNNGLTPVWEPFLMVYKNQLIVYYSDQRDSAHGQKLVHQVSSNAVTWGAVVNDVAYSTYDWRPGMTTVALLPNGKYIMTYEFYGATEANFAVYFRIAADPTTFNSAPGYVVKATDGTVPVGSPYVTWTPAGGASGSIVVSASSSGYVFVNRELGKNAWAKIATPQAAAYSRSLLIMPNNSDLMIMGANQGSTHAVTVSVMDLAAAIKAG